MTRLRRLLFAALVAASVVVFAANPAGAHTGFDSSEPADGAVVTGELDTITIRFTNEAVETGEGFVVLDPVLGVRTPTTIERPDIGAFVLGFDPPISPGTVGVRWTVKAPDAHPINGSFQFTINGSPTPTTSQSTRDEQPQSSPSTTQQTASGAAPDLDEFLEAESGSSAGRWIGDVGRLLSMAGMMVTLGFIVFAVTVMRGTRAELRMLLFWIRRAAVVIVIGTLLDGGGQLMDESGRGFAALVDPGAYADTLWGSLGFSLLLRVASATIVAATARISMVHAHDARDVLARVSAALPVGAGSTRVADHPPDYWEDHDVAWDIDRHGLLPTLGFALMLLSHTYDGHTITEGSRLLTGAASAMHVLAAAVWVGGVAALALIIRSRDRRGEPTHALVMVTRYSVIATFALVAVAVLGLYLAWVILDAPSDLWATPWGRLLIGKVVVVAVATGFGAHNHHVIVPALEAAEEDDHAVTRLRATLRYEVLALAVVTALTAFLVRAASNL